MLYKGFKQDIIACVGEFIGTTMFIFLGLGTIKTAQNSQTFVQSQTATSLSNQTILFISIGMGLSLLVTAWTFFRITGGLFNPAVTLALWLIGGLKLVRAILLTVAQIAGGIAGAALVEGMTPSSGVSAGGVANTITKLEPGMSIVKGVFLEAFLTAMLVFVILMLAAEKHRATYLAPVGIGLTLFVCQMFGTLWTGCGMNPARSFGPSVVAGSFPGYHWIYWVGPLIGSLISTAIYSLLKLFDYTSVVLGQDSDDAAKAPPIPVFEKVWHAGMGYTRDQRTAMLSSGMRPADIERNEASMVATAGTAQMTQKNGNANGGHYIPADAFVSGRPKHTTRVSGRRNNSDANGRMTTGNVERAPSPDPPLMHSGQQEVGGLGAPGKHGSGITNSSYVKKVLHT